jgi:putative polyhydroxyalkanoate system protein
VQCGRRRSRDRAPRALHGNIHRDRARSDMARISIGKQHRLSHQKAKVVAERLANDLEKRFDLAWNWEGDHVHFERPGVSGSMHVGASQITLEVRLGLLLTPLKPAIEREIHAQLDKLTGSKTA